MSEEEAVQVSENEDDTREYDTPPQIIAPQTLFSLGELDIIEEIGRGGMATVYKAYSKKWRKIRAVKVLAREYSEQKRFAERFEEEARMDIELRYDKIVAVYDENKENNTYYIEMEYIDGFTIKDILDRSRQRRIPLSMALSITSEVCKALSYAHKRGIVHRDVKPANIMITKDGLVKLADFGIAKALEYASTTTHSTRVGTPAYMSPEQVEGQKLDTRTDIYSLGITLYEMVTGKKPLAGKPLGRLDIPGPIMVKQKIKQIVNKAIEENAESRYQNITLMDEEIEKCLHSLRIRDIKGEVLKYLYEKEETKTRKEKKTIIRKIAASVLALLTLVGTITYLLLPQKGAIMVSSDLSGIKVNFDGKELGLTTDKFLLIPKVSKGYHAIEVNLIGHKVGSIRRTLIIDGGYELIEVEFLPQIIREAQLKQEEKVED